MGMVVFANSRSENRELAVLCLFKKTAQEDAGLADTTKRKCLKVIRQIFFKYDFTYNKEMFTFVFSVFK